MITPNSPIKNGTILYDEYPAKSGINAAIIISIFCGALLGGTGAVFQGFFRNPLADAGIMGVSSGATFGAVMTSVFGGVFSFSLNFKLS